MFPMTYDATIVPKSDNEDYCSSEQNERDIEQIIDDIQELINDYLETKEGPDNPED